VCVYSLPSTRPRRGSRNSSDKPMKISLLLWLAINSILWLNNRTSVLSQQLTPRHMQRKLDYCSSRLQQKLRRMFVSYSQRLRRSFPWTKQDRGIRDQALDLVLFFDRKRPARKPADHAPVRIIMRSWAIMEMFKVAADVIRASRRYFDAVDTSYLMLWGCSNQATSTAFDMSL